MLTFCGILGTFIVSIFLAIIIVRLISDRNVANAIIAGRQTEQRKALLVEKYAESGFSN